MGWQGFLARRLKVCGVSADNAVGWRSCVRGRGAEQSRTALAAPVTLAALYAFVCFNMRNARSIGLL